MNYNIDMIKITQTEILIVAECLFVFLLFLMFVLRMCFYLFMLRADPAKALTDLLKPNWFKKHKEAEKARENTEKFS